MAGENWREEYRDQDEPRGAYREPYEDYERRPNIPNHLGLAIFTTICCCVPFGIVSIIYASQVSGHISSGNMRAAIRASEDAKKWANIGIALGLIGSVLYIGLQVLVLANQKNNF